MLSLPHSYTVRSQGNSDSLLEVSAQGLPGMQVAPPANFGGPGDQWSPEDLLVAAVANCFILSFKAIAKASAFHWKHIECETTGDLDKTERGMAFTKMSNTVTLHIDDAEDTAKAQRLIEKAEKTCLITNSLQCNCTLQAQIIVNT